MNRSSALVTIGMPAYNGGRYLAKALDSLLAQEYQSWELVISDDCSTDNTQQVARAYAGRDARISYVRQPTNLGEMANFNFALGQARGPYFMWAADHDMWQPTFISSCVAALEAKPEAVLAYPQSLLVDEDGAVIEEMDDQVDLEQTSALDRYKHLIWHLSICNMIYGVARRDAMVAAGGYRDVLAPDRLVLARLALQGTILRTGGFLYLRRRNRPPETPDGARLRQLTELNPATAAERTALPAPSLFRALRDLHLQAVRESSLPSSEKLDARIATLACFHMRFHVASNLVRVQKGLAVATRQTPRLDRSWGRR